MKEGEKLAKKQKKWHQKSRPYRAITQGLVFIFIFYIFIRHILFYDRNLEEYCPFGGFETLFSYLTTGEFLKNVGMTNLVLFLLVIIITLIFRNGFCSWICPLGTLQDIIKQFGKSLTFLPGIKQINKKYKRFLKNNKELIYNFDHQARYIKYFILLFAIVGTWISSSLIIREYDPIIAIIKILTFQLTIAFAILVILGILSLFIQRPFCKYLCLMGATINIIGKISPLRIVRNEDTCTSCNLCSRNCPMTIDIANQKKIDTIDCTHCFNCIDDCPTEGALTLQYFPKDLYNLEKKKEFLKGLGSETID